MEVQADTNRFCRKCQTEQPAGCFRNQFGICGPCRASYQRTYNATSAGWSVKLHEQAKHSAAKRLSRGRDVAATLSITSENILQIYNMQNGHCYYSGLPMVMESGDTVNWVCSLERKDPSLGYVVENIALCVAELNGPAQWTRAKIAELILLCECIPDPAQLQQAVAQARTSNKPNNGGNNVHIERLIETREGVRFLNCTGCLAMKPDDHYVRSKFGCGRRSRCRGCRTSERQKERDDSMRSMLMAAIKTLGVRERKVRVPAEEDSKKRKRQAVPADNVITFEQLLDKVLAQAGRCYYSGVPLQFVIHKDWRCSVERVDNAQGYTAENTVLVALEFNTAKQWSKAKFATFLESCKSHVNVQ